MLFFTMTLIITEQIYRLTRKRGGGKRKDPILFGVIAGSNKLYFIGDWIDEYCDLRFDDVVNNARTISCQKTFLWMILQIATQSLAETESIAAVAASIDTRLL